MKSMLKIALVSITLGLTVTAAQAGDTLKDYGTMKGRTYHGFFHEEGDCQACHGENVAGYPADDSCATCHDVDDLAQATARKGDELWQNPHNNLHYGKDVPCTECHAEHKVKEPMCNDCHTFKFPNHKQ